MRARPLSGGATLRTFYTTRRLKVSDAEFYGVRGGGMAS